jgi:hypothetical protein
VPLARKWLAFLSASVLIGLSLTGMAVTADGPRERYMRAYEDIAGRPAVYEEGQLPPIGRRNCQSLEDGYSLPDVYTDNLILGLSGDQAGFTIEAAIRVYCPQFSSLLED